MDRDGTNGIPADELSGDVGRPDPTTMRAVGELFREQEPLVESVTFDDALSPRALRIAFADGIADAMRCRLDVTWYQSDAYRFHYVDDAEVNWRFDRHPNPHSPEKHFHQPPEAPSETAVPSCIEVEESRLVAMAVWKLWRRAYETGDLDVLNEANGPR